MTTATATPPRLLTAADLAALPDDGRKYELDDGRLVVMPPPGDIHGFVQGQVTFHLTDQGQRRGLGQTRGEVGVVLRRNPDRVVGADAAFLLSASLPPRRTPEGYLGTVPEIVVEIRSRNDTLPEVLAKRDEYFAAGGKVLWVLDPDDRTVAVHTAGADPAVFGPDDTLTCPLLPGFAVPVAGLFPPPAGG